MGLVSEQESRFHFLSSVGHHLFELAIMW